MSRLSFLFMYLTLASPLAVGAGGPVALAQPAQPNLKWAPCGDVPDTEADVTELIQAVGYTPKVSVATGIANFVQWYEGYYGL